MCYFTWKRCLLPRVPRCDEKSNKIRPMTISMRTPRWLYPYVLRWCCWFWLIPFKSRTELSGDSEPSETQRRRRQIPGEGGWRGEEPGPGGDAADTDNTGLSYRQYAGWAKWQGMMCTGDVTDGWLLHSLLQVRSLTVVLAISLLDRGITPVTADGNPDPLPHPQILIRNPGMKKVVYSFILLDASFNFRGSWQQTFSWVHPSQGLRRLGRRSVSVQTSETEISAIR